LEVIPKEGMLEKLFAQKVVYKFFGQVWGNSGKNPSQPLLLYTCAVKRFALSQFLVDDGNYFNDIKSGSRSTYRIFI